MQSDKCRNIKLTAVDTKGKKMGNKEEKKFSIVVPVYNVEKYIDRCVASIVNQTYTNWEMILVDDGSPDNCPKLCDEYAEKDERIRVIHQSNKGLSGARNTGIKHIRGDMLLLVDSDDWLVDDALAGIADSFTDDMDMCFYDYYEAVGGVKFNRNRCFDRDSIDFNAPGQYSIDDLEKAVCMIGFKGCLATNVGAVWNIVYNIKKIKECDLMFPENTALVEDRAFVLNCLMNFSNISYRAIPIYNYFWNEGSLSTMSYAGKIDRFLPIMTRLTDYVESINYPSAEWKEKGVCHFYGVTAKIMIWHLSDLRDKGEKRKAREYCNSCAKRIVNSGVGGFSISDKALFNLTAKRMFLIVEAIVNSRRFLKGIMKKR